MKSNCKLVILTFCRAKIILKGYANIYQMRWASCEMLSYLCSCCSKAKTAFIHVSTSGFTRYLRQNWDFLVKMRTITTSLLSCLRWANCGCYYTVCFSLLNQFSLTLCTVISLSLYRWWRTQSLTSPWPSGSSAKFQSSSFLTRTSRRWS